MGWVRIDDAMFDHAKVLRAGPLGVAMQLAGLCYCNRNLTDGFIPTEKAALLLNLGGLGMQMWEGETIGGGKDASWELVVAELVEAGLWIQTDGGWQIHNYLNYQPSREQVEMERRKASERMASRRAALTSGDVRKNFAVRSLAPNPNPKPKGETEVNKTGEAIQPGKEGSTRLERGSPARSNSAKPNSHAQPPANLSDFVQFVLATWPDVAKAWELEGVCREAYPGLDLLAEAKKARAWELSDPKRRKARHGRFLTGWFAKAQDWASRSMNGKRNGQAEVSPPYYLPFPKDGG